MPSSTRFAALVDTLGKISRNCSRQNVAGPSVLKAGPCCVERILGSWPAYDGSMRIPAAGSDESGAAERIVMNAVPPFAGSV